MKKAVTGLFAIFALAGSASVLAAACNSVAAVNNWSAVATWSCGHVPANGDDVTITAGGTTTLDAVAPSASLDSLTVNGALIVGNNLNVNFVAASPLTVNGGGKLQIGNSAAARTVIVTGNITTVGTGAISVGAFAATHILTVGGNITNAGTINLVQAAGQVCNVTFNHNGGQTVSGAGAYTFNLVTLNMGATNANILDMQSAFTAPAGFLTITNGTYKHDSATNITPWTTAAGATIPATGGFWLNSAATVTVSAGVNVTINGGYLRISSGTMTIGNTDTTLLVLGNFATTLFQIDAGALNVTGGINSSANAGAGTFTMNGGTITLQSIDAGAVYSLLLGSATTINWSNGTIITVNGNNATDDIDIRSATVNVTGGTLQYGNGAAPVSTNQFSLINGAGGNLTLGNLVADIGGNGSYQTVLMRSSTTILSSVTIGALNNLAPNAGLAINVGAGANSGVWTNNGTFSQSTTNVTFGGAGAASIIGGTTSTTFYQLTLNESAPVLANRVVTLGINTTVTNGLTFTNGMINAAAFTVIIPAGGTVTRGAGCSADGSVNGCFVIGNLQQNFAGGAQTRTYEVGSTATGVAYAPVAITLANVTTAGNIVVSTTAGDHPNLGTSGLDPTKSANRYWTITNVGTVFAANAGNSLAFNFVAADLDPGANPLAFNVGRYNAPSWTITPPPAPVDNATSTAIAGVTITAAALPGQYAVADTLVVVPPPSSFNAFESSTGANSIVGKIYTKLAGTAFSLDVVAILAGVQEVAFTNNVTVSLVANTTGAALSANNCPTVFTTIPGSTATAMITGGRSTVPFAAVAAAYRNVRVMVQFPTVAPTVTACSTDNFAIRPTAFVVTSTTATQTSSIGVPIIKAGAFFDLSAAAVNLAGTSIIGYDGIPSINNAVGNLVGSPTAGTIGGAFSAAPIGTGTATGVTFSYSEVGNFGLNTDAVYDSSFTSVDQPADCTPDFSNSLVGGKYGCSFGNTAVPSGGGPNGFGRFTPDHFDVTATTPPALGSACVLGGFTYVGQLFNYATPPVLTVTARNSAGATTTNYAGAYMNLSDPSLINGVGGNGAYNTQAKRYLRFDALGGGLTPTLDTSTLPSTAADPAVSFPAAPSGVGTLTFATNNGANTGLFFTRTTPNKNFTADIALALDIVDTDQVAYQGGPPADKALFSMGSIAVAGNGMAFSPAGGNIIYYGRMRMNNANGSELLPLSVGLSTQYYNGAAFTTNTLDNCTSLVAANISRGNFQGNLTALQANPSFVSGTFAAGLNTLTLSKPGSGKNGTLDLAINLEPAAVTAPVTCLAIAGAAPTTGANLTFLQDVQSCSIPNYTRDPTAHATFGVYTGSTNAIYQRENY